ncbi:MAG: hypothetical protein QOH43_4958 [Solirubrobacteraceae bacterium]|nr:hypothetical protein [Solirubrobacteraceae bacterium]
MAARRVPRAVHWTLVALAAWCAVRELSILTGIGDAQHGLAFSKAALWTVAISASLLCMARAARGTERLPWLLIGSGGLLWALGDVYWGVVLADKDVIPVPSLADAGYLLFPPLVFAGLCGLVRSRRRGAPRTLWIDGVTAALAAGSVSAAIVLQVALQTTSGDVLAVATNLAYPLSDLILLGLVVTAVALGGWRLDRTWATLGAGVLLFWVADSAYLVTVAQESYSYPGPADTGWTLSLVLLATAAWQPAGAAAAARRSGGVRVAVLPLLFALMGLGVLIVGAIGDLNPLAVALAALSLLAVLVRLLLTLRENAAMLAASRHEALTDPLTGLGNRRALTRELEQRLAAGPAAPPFVLALFDLDGFKHYNDSFGHPAGDALLERLGGKLAAHVAAAGRAFRMGGDEFCAVLEGSEADALGAAAGATLAEQGEGFAIGASFGAVSVPGETDEPAEALRLADGRMYARKHSGRVSADRQSRDVLLRVLAERNPELSDHIDGVADLAADVAVRMGLDDAAVALVRHAAELHDVGKIAIPDAILSKPGPLDEAEWAFMHRHTLIGERIVLAAPALRGVAGLVRASHERWDGTGYPDRLAGEDIPLGARIVAVCDAYDAMVSARPYQHALPEAQALAELCRCAGGQFDPAVVQAFVAVRTEVRDRPAVAA